MNAQIKVACLALGLCLTISHAPNAFAEGGVAGGGGDEVGMMFLSSALGVAVEIKDQAANFPELAGIDLLAVAQSASVTVSDTPLLAKLPDGTSQESIALNFPTSGRIKVNRTRWEHLSNEFVRRGIALHELLGLKGIETTGNYPYSGRYLATHGYDLNVFKVTPILRPGTYVPIQIKAGSRSCAYEIEVDETKNQIFLTATMNPATGMPCSFGTNGPTVIAQCEHRLGQNCTSLYPVNGEFGESRRDDMWITLNLLPDGNLLVSHRHYKDADTADLTLKYRFASEKMLKPYVFAASAENEVPYIGGSPKTKEGCRLRLEDAKAKLLNKCRLETQNPKQCRFSRVEGGNLDYYEGIQHYPIHYCRKFAIEVRAD